MMAQIDSTKNADGIENQYFFERLTAPSSSIVSPEKNKRIVN